MSEAVPGVLITATFLLVTGFTFFSLLNIWTEHSSLLNEAVLLQESRLQTRLDISDIGIAEDTCPNYAGPFDAHVAYAGTTPLNDPSQMDVFVEYVDAADNKVVSRLQHGADWSVSNLAPDDRNPNQWDPAETGTVNFGLAPALKPGTSGVILIASPQGNSSSRYFTCPGACSGVTGFLSPTAEAADTGGDGDGFEDSPTNAFADDGSPASSVNASSTGDRHQYFSYGFSVVDACVIEGIEVRLDWWLSSSDGDNSMDVELSWDGGSSWTVAKRDAAETMSEHTAVLGGPADDWGHNWQPRELDDSTFRVRVITNNGAASQTFSLDWVAVNVYFGPP